MGFFSSPSHLSLADIQCGDCVCIDAFFCDEVLASRLMSLGFLVGTTLTLVSKLPFGGPLAVDLQGGRIALSREDAKAVGVSHTLERMSHAYA